MVSLHKRVLTSCSITRACSGSTTVNRTLLNGGGRDPNWILFLQSAGPNETCLAKASMLQDGLLLLLASCGIGVATSVLRSESAGNDQPDCSNILFGGCERAANLTLASGLPLHRNLLCKKDSPQICLLLRQLWLWLLLLRPV